MYKRSPCKPLPYFDPSYATERRMHLHRKLSCIQPVGSGMREVCGVSRGSELKLAP